MQIPELKTTLREVKWELDGLSVIQLVSVTSIFTLFMIIPLVSVLYYAFVYQGSFSLFWIKQIFSDAFYFPDSLSSMSLTFYRRAGGNRILITGPDLGVIPNTIFVGTCTTIFATVIGVTLAFIFSRYDFPLKDYFRVAIMVPMLSIPFVGAIGLKKMIHADGFLNTLFYEKLGILPVKIGVEGLAAVIFVQTLMFYPIVYVNAFTAFMNIDPAMEEQAKNLGSHGFHLFRTVTLPLALPGIEAGAILTLILSIEDLGTPIVFQGTTAEKTLTYQIFTKIFTPKGLIRPDATALAAILLSISIFSFVAIRKYVSMRKYAMLTKGEAGKRMISKASKLQCVLIYMLLTGILFFALLPHIGVFLLAFSETWGTRLLPESFTIANFRAIFTNKDVIRAFTNSLSYSTAATFLIIVLGTSAAYLVSRKHIPGMSLLDTLVTLPISIPGVVIATGLFLVFLNSPLDPLKSPIPLLILSYTIRKFPFTVRSAFAGFEQTHVEFEEAALNLGASRLKTFVDISLKLVWMNILAGGMLSFVYCMNEVSTGIVIGSAKPEEGPITLKMLDVLYMLAGGPHMTAAIGVILMMLQLASILVSTYLLRQKATALISI